MKAIGNAAVLVIINPATQHFQVLAMPGLVRIEFRGAVQSLTRLPIFARGIVELKQLQQRVAVFMLAVGGVKELDQVLREAQRPLSVVRHLIHAGDELAPPSRRGFMQVKLLRQFQGAARVIHVQVDAQRGTRRWSIGKLNIEFSRPRRQGVELEVTENPGGAPSQFRGERYRNRAW